MIPNLLKVNRIDIHKFFSLFRLQINPCRLVVTQQLRNDLDDIIVKDDVLLYPKIKVVTEEEKSLEIIDEGGVFCRSSDFLSDDVSGVK